MARTTLLARTRIAPGDTRTAPSIDVGGKRECTIYFDPNLTDYNDATFEFEVVVSESRDGGSNWRQVYRTTYVGGARTKDGGLPFSSVRTNDGEPWPEGTLIKVDYLHNKNYRMGMESESL